MTMLKQKIKLLVYLFICANFVQAQTVGFRYQAKLAGVTQNWHSLTIPNAVFDKAKGGLEDLRIYGFKGKDTIEVPYMLEKSADQITQKEVDFNIINQSETSGGYYYTLQTNHLTLINQIKLWFKQSNFDWQVTLEGSSDSKQWFTILKDYRILAIKNNSTDYHFTQLNFPESKYIYYRILIKSKEQPELSAAKISKLDTLKGIEKDITYQQYQLNNAIKSKESIISIDLGETTPVSFLKLNPESTLDYYRTIKIEYATDSFSTDKGTRYHYEKVFEGTISSLEPTEFKFDAVLTHRLQITIQNDDNQPLRFKPPILKGPIYEMIARFDKIDYQYALYYGNKDVDAPVYELKNFENKIPIQLMELTVGKTDDNPAYTSPKLKAPLFEHKAWLWALMGIIISLLGFFAYKMLKEK
jgi:hypothetical protein